MEERGHPTGAGRRTGPTRLPNSGCQTSRRIGRQFGKNSTKNATGVWEGTVTQSLRQQARSALKFLGGTTAALHMVIQSIGSEAD